MKVIHKYRISDYHWNVGMPAGAEILSVQSQNNEVTIWALVDFGVEPEVREFRLIKTGQEFSPGNLKFLGTVQLDQSTFVVHVFEVVK